MPIPLILAGIALATGAYGVSQGIDAMNNFDEANSINEDAQHIYDVASRDLEKARDATQEALENLGQLKFELYEHRLIPFVAAFKKIHNIDFQHDVFNEELRPNVDQADMLSVEAVANKMTEVIGGGITALGAGGLAGLAAYGSVGFLASASTGTAIAGLSGAAATNATLAWLGGGALSAGGWGMAGGAYVLGGIVAGPVLAIGGMLLASKAEEAKHNAYSNLSKARLAAEEMETAKVAVQSIRIRMQEIYQTLEKMDAIFIDLLAGIQRIVGRSPKKWLVFGKVDYSKLSKEDQIGVMASMMMAKTIKNIMETPILDEQGSLTEESKKIKSLANHQAKETQKLLMEVV